METLTIDGEVVMISSLPDNMKSMATLYEYTMNQEMEARKQLAMVESARSELGRRITTSYAEYKQAVATVMEQQNNPDGGVVPGATAPVQTDIE